MGMVVTNSNSTICEARPAQEEKQSTVNLHPIQLGCEPEIAGDTSQTASTLMHKIAEIQETI